MRTRWLLRLALLTLGLACAAAPAGAEPGTFPQPARDRFSEGQKLQQKGQYRDAIRAYEDAIRAGMKAFPRVHLYRANSYLELKEYDEAIARYTQFLEQFTLEDSCRY